MDIRKLQRAIVDGLEGVKAQNIVVFNTEAQSPLFERVIVASGTSNRQTKALAASVRDEVKARGFPVLATEGEANGEWIIVDCGAAVAHIMQPAVRDYYRLEEIWGAKAVNMKMGAGTPDAGKRAAAPAKKTDGAKKAGAPAKKASASKKPAAKRAAAKKGAGAPRQTPGRAPGQGRAQAPAKAGGRAPVRALGKASGKAPGKKAPGKAPARKPTARKPAARKP